MTERKVIFDAVFFCLLLSAAHDSVVFSFWQMVFCSLTEFQKAVYQAVLETDDVTLVLRAGEPCSCNSGKKRKNCCYKVRTWHCLDFRA